jgi:NAD(P)-dependent dehydrogenase (short-subunit alcohol dehydrogenase family)
MDNAYSLNGKVVLLIGGAGYLGWPAARLMAARGAAVAVADVTEEKAARAARDIEAAVPGARVLALAADATDESALASAMDRTAAWGGGLHAAVNTAYKSVGKRVEEITAEEFDAAMHANLFGCLAFARQAARVMREGGSIVLFSSMYGMVAPDPRVYEPPMKPNPIEYGVAKAGVLQMTRYLAAYWGARGLRVNAVVPGPFPWDQTQQDHPGFVARLAGRTCLGRIGRRDEIAGAVAFLASDDSAYVTGQALVVDGGWTAW